MLEIYFKINGKLNEPKVTPQPHKSLIEKPEAIDNLGAIIDAFDGILKKFRSHQSWVLVDNRTY